MYKGAEEPIMMLNGLAAWVAALTKWGTVRKLRGVQRLADLAMTGCSSTSVALALADLLSTEIAAGKLLVQQYYTAMPLCPEDWRPSAPHANGRHTCGTFGSCCCQPGSGWTRASSGACRTTRWSTQPSTWRSA